MKKSTLALIALLLALVMMLSSLAACTGNSQTNQPEETDETDNTESSSEKDGNEDVEETTDKESDEVVKADPIPLEGPYASTIKLANKYANGVNVSYPSAARDSILITNRNMSLTYNTHSFSDKLVGSIKNSEGKAYIENTMDVYVKMAGSDSLFYASKSTSPALMNVYRYGYYYYQVLIDNQDFTNSFTVEKELDLELNKPDGTGNVEETTASEKGAIAYTVSSTYDPDSLHHIVSPLCGR